MSTALSQMDPLTRRRYTWKVTLSSLLGNTLEYYDFLVFGTASALVFPKLFFPSSDPFISTLTALLTFAVGFLARPVGGMFFGRRGDQQGRKSTLIITLTIMGLGTILIGALPTYQTIGVFAPILLVLLRLIQGFAVGGEWGGSMIIVLESAPQKKRGFYTAWPNTGGFTAQLLITGIFAWVLSLNEDALYSWGWRIPFLASAVVLLVGVYMRRSLHETPIFAEAHQQDLAAVEYQRRVADGLPVDEPEVKAAEAFHLEGSTKPKRGPLASIFLEDWRSLLLIIGLRLAEGLPYFLLTVFALSYVKNHDFGITSKQLQYSILIIAVIAIPLHGFYGWLSDKYGRRPVYFFGTIVVFVTAFPFFGLLQSGSFLLATLGYVLVLNLGHNAINAVQPSFFAELFPADRRYSGAAAGREIASIITGLTPFIATALAGSDGRHWPLITAYVMVGAAITFVAVWLAPETYKRDLSQVGSYK